MNPLQYTRDILDDVRRADSQNGITLSLQIRISLQIVCRGVGMQMSLPVDLDDEHRVGTEEVRDVWAD